jgi:antibiotic biosynthesis monooxygenase (ABM) superfamily enzyme
MGKFIADVAWVYPVALIVAIALAPHLAKLSIVPRVLISSLLIAATSKYATGPIRRWWRRKRMLPQNAEVR